MAEHAPNARLQQIPGAGHAAPMTHPEAFVAAVTEFLEPVQQPA